MLDFDFPVVEFSQKLNKTHQAIHKYCGDHSIPISSRKGRSYIAPQEIRQYLTSFGFEYPKEVISFQACKGGVGKTSLCYNIATRVAQYGAKVLVVDLDMQGHITMALWNPENNKFPVWHNVMSKSNKITEVIQEIHPHLHLIPSNLDNSHNDKTISQSHKIIYKNYVSKHLNEIRDQYDLILIDCSPALSHINTAISLASDRVLIPVNPDIFSFDGLEKTLHELKDIESEFNHQLEVNIILNRFDAREKNSLDVIVGLKNKYGPLLSSSVVVVSADIKNSIMNRELLFKSRKKSNAAEDIDEIAKEILNIKELTDA